VLRIRHAELSVGETHRQNCFDLSQNKGFEVDFDVLERGDGPGGPPESIHIPA